LRLLDLRCFAASDAILSACLSAAKLSWPPVRDRALERSHAVGRLGTLGRRPRLRFRIAAPVEVARPEHVADHTDQAEYEYRRPVPHEHTVPPSSGSRMNAYAGWLRRTNAIRWFLASAQVIPPLP